MDDNHRCPKCHGTNIEKGNQEVFPSTFMKVSKYSAFRALVSSKEFEIRACMDCGYAEWFINKKHLQKGGV